MKDIEKKIEEQIKQSVTGDETLSIEELENTEGGDFCGNSCLIACTPGNFWGTGEKKDT